MFPAVINLDIGQGTAIPTDQTTMEEIQQLSTETSTEMEQHNYKSRSTP